MISQKETEILRTLAGKMAEYAAQPVQEQKKKLWTMHNDLKTDEPIVMISPENGWNEIIPPNTLLCEDPWARAWENELRQQIYHAEHLKDDTVIDAEITVPLISTNDGWGVELQKKGGGHGGAYIVEPAIEEYEEDFEKIHYPHYTVDEKASAALLAEAHRIFDGILKVTPYHMWWWSMGMTWSYIDLRGLENFLCDFVIEPEWVHKMMDLLCSGVLSLIDQMEAEGHLYSNNGNRYVGSGGFGFTNDLPRLPGACKAKDMWGFVESQETSSISPEMYGEFIFPYHKRIAERFGLNCYGCCEAFEGRWKYVSQLPNLRRVSCSPWSNRSISPEILGNRYISSYKLMPTPLASPHLDEDEVRRNLRDVLDHCQGTVPELIMKDTHTLGNNPENAIRWVELAREEIART